MEGTSLVLQLRYLFGIFRGIFLSVLTPMTLTFGIRCYCTSCRIRGVGWYMYKVRVGDHCTPVTIQPRTTSNWDPG